MNTYSDIHLCQTNLYKYIRVKIVTNATLWFKWSLILMHVCSTILNSDARVNDACIYDPTAGNTTFSGSDESSEKLLQPLENSEQGAVLETRDL